MSGHYLPDEDDDEYAEAKKRFAPVLQRQRTRTVQEMVIPSCPRRPERRVPWLSISGRWLEQAGFLPGTQASIQVRRGRITITPAPTGKEET